MVVKACYSVQKMEFLEHECVRFFIKYNFFPLTVKYRSCQDFSKEEEGEGVEVSNPCAER